MKRLMTTIIATAALAAGFSGLAISAEPAIGSWTLDLAKSHYAEGRAPKAQTRVYQETAGGVEMTVTGTTADGGAMNMHAVFKYDGKTYPVAGGGYFDSLKLTRIDDHHVKSTQWMGNKQVGETTRDVSADGQTMTLTSKGKDAKGVAFTDVSVYHRTK